MKQQFKKWMAAALLTILTAGVFAQNKEPVARWVSDKGYWVVESNIHSPHNHIIRFYTNENVLVYTETLNSVKMNPDKRKVKLKLKEVLESSIVAWQKNKQPEANKDYVTAILK